MYEKGTVVISLSGRDRGYYLAVVDSDEKYVYVCDGKERPLNNPKRKNPLHIKQTGYSIGEGPIKTGNRALRKALAAAKAGCKQED